jgi:hypothetical protein
MHLKLEMDKSIFDSMEHLTGGGISILGILLLGIGWIGQARLKRREKSAELLLVWEKAFKPTSEAVKLLRVNPKGVAEIATPAQYPLEDIIQIASSVSSLTEIRRATIGLTSRRTARRINRLEGIVADIPPAYYTRLPPTSSRLSIGFRSATLGFGTETTLSSTMEKIKWTRKKINLF